MTHTQAIKQTMKRILTLILLSCCLGFAQAETAYIDDTLLVPLRSGAGTSYRIIHKGIPSGTALEVIERSAETGYAQVRTPAGLEGYLPSRYLVNQPIARDRLSSALKTLDSTRKQNAELKKQASDLQAELNTLKQNYASTSKNLEANQSELENIKSISANALNLDRKNRELRESNEQLRNELELLQVENIRLKDRSESNMMLIGGALVLLGIIIALILPMLKPSKKNDSWA